jgi:predicted RNA methylase
MKQQKGLKRNTLDKFYTKSDIVIQCINSVKKYINITNNDLIIEPSAGNGAFISQIKMLSNNVICYDIEPENDNIIKQDFLELNHNKIKTNYKKIHIIGNPPFGRQSCLAIKFIKKCCCFANSISFILPKSFKKESMKKHFLKNYHLVFEMDLPDNSFTVNKIESNVPCVFQIWKYKKIERDVINKIEPIGFQFVKKDENPNISFRRVGVNAGTITEKPDDKNTQSHYFIKFISKIDVNKLKLIKFEFNNTVGPKSISKQELITEFNKLF